MTERLSQCPPTQSSLLHGLHTGCWYRGSTFCTSSFSGLHVLTATGQSTSLFSQCCQGTEDQDQGNGTVYLFNPFARVSYRFISFMEDRVWLFGHSGSPQHSIVHLSNWIRFDSTFDSTFDSGDLLIVISLFHVLILFQFLAASKGQPRLALLVNTLEKAFQDIVHLLLV